MTVSSSNLSPTTSPVRAFSASRNGECAVCVTSHPTTTNCHKPHDRIRIHGSLADNTSTLPSEEGSRIENPCSTYGRKRPSPTSKTRDPIKRSGNQSVGTFRMRTGGVLRAG